jgi:AraC-like DNA-binding protein
MLMGRLRQFPVPSVERPIRPVHLAYAEGELYDRAYTLEHIAEQVGVSDASHLSRVFHQYVGYRPGTFRRHILGT